jgi:hypothetical protein
MHIGYWWESQKEKDNIEDKCIGEWIILKRILERESETEDGMEWIYLAQDRDQWRALVNTLMNLWVP